MELTERRADLRAAFLIYDMLYIFVTETLQSTDDRKRRTLTKTAQSHTLNHVCKFFQLIQGFFHIVILSGLNTNQNHSLF